MDIAPTFHNLSRPCDIPKKFVKSDGEVTPCLSIESMLIANVSNTEIATTPSSNHSLDALPHTQTSTGHLIPRTNHHPRSSSDLCGFLQYRHSSPRLSMRSLHTSKPPSTQFNSEPEYTSQVTLLYHTMRSNPLYNLKSSHQSPSPKLRVYRPVRQRIRRTCHHCGMAFQRSYNCTSCQHRRCDKCPREPRRRQSEEDEGGQGQVEGDAAEG